MTTLTSPPPSPLLARSSSGDSSSSHIMSHMPLSVSNVANLFVKMRRHRAKAKAHHIESSSGDEPQTHPSLEGAASVERIPLEKNETFVCRDGVDATKLLRAVRGALYEKAQTFGANVLVDERYVAFSPARPSSHPNAHSRDLRRWTCTICGPRHRSDGTFRVYIHYSANAARSDRRDPQRPVALEKARGVPGLMTILNRLD
ncbi:hypothetical protein BN946_scf184999.g10 [Trametes cinnabarina]|uniref:Uncharacterized protein n=1 Tax=Pycnoporus cinnabarinus TaxID=5643 RepID=A0A060S7P5_PYCCI|nr:hypothetical protein BN946_scf184999.g10 [Trametes cinnabarina]